MNRQRSNHSSKSNHTRRRYQEGSVARVKRATGPDAWVYRWREYSGGKVINKKRVIGDIEQLPRKADAQKAVENLRAEINAAQDRLGKMTVGEAWGHFQVHELRDPNVGRSPSTINTYLDYFKSQIIPEWGNVLLDDVKAVAVEKWLRGLDLAPGTKSKLRNLMSALFSHCIRHELYSKQNPIATVRQSGLRQRDPDVLTVDELKKIVDEITSPVIRVMVLTAATSALRRSELRGLKWADLDFDNLWFNLRRGLVRKDETRMKTKAPRKGVPMSLEIAEVLRHWRTETPYPMDEDWVFASPFTEGKRPYWCESAMQDHIKPAVQRAGIKKHVSWHVFRHSLASLLGHQGTDVKVVQELLRHASSRITQDVYQQADQSAKRSALTHVSGLFVVADQKAG